MGRCRATTRKGTRCRNSTMEGSEYCGVHVDRDSSSGRDPGSDPVAGLGESARTVLGLAAVGLVVLIGLKLGRRF